MFYTFFIFKTYLLIMKDKNKDILIKVLLKLNKDLFDNNYITYQSFKSTEEKILKNLMK